MSLSAKVRRAPLRIATGAFILNAGIGKLKGSEAAANQIHGMAAGALPPVANLQPKPFLKTLAVGEVALGAALLLPIVPAGLAGLALTGFSGLLVGGVYWRTPGLHEDGSPRPTQQGTAIAKDIWMLGIGVSLVADAILEPAHDKRIELTHDVKSGAARRAAKASSAAKLARAKAETRAARAARKASRRATKQALAVRGAAATATSASRAAYDKVTP